MRTALLALALAILASRPAAAQPVRPPNIVFLLADDLGWTDTGAFGSDLYETPNLDRLAREGTSFKQAYAACTVCSPTRASIMTGLYPARLHLTDWIPGYVAERPKLRVPDWTQFLDPAYPNLAKSLRDAGYATAHFGKWHLGKDERYWPEHQGFDVNFGGWSAGSPYHQKGANGYFSPYGNPRLSDGPKGEHLDLRLAREAVKFIERNRDHPFFVNFWLYDVHLPLQADAAQREHFQARVREGARHHNPTYASMVAKMDEAAGMVLDALDRLGLAANTIVVFTSDNGGLLGLHGRDGPPRVTSNAPLRAGKGSVYEGGVRVPLTVRWPGHVPAGAWSQEWVISPDYYPTLLALAGLPRPSQPLDGIDVSPVLLDPKARLSRDALYWHYPHYHGEGATPYGAIRKGDWRLVEFFETGRCELYNLAADPGERHDLSATRTAKRDELLGELKAWRQRVGAQLPTPATGAEPRAKRRQEVEE